MDSGVVTKEEDQQSQFIRSQWTDECGHKLWEQALAQRRAGTSHVSWQEILPRFPGFTLVRLPCMISSNKHKVSLAVSYLCTPVAMSSRCVLSYHWAGNLWVYAVCLSILCQA